MADHPDVPAFMRQRITWTAVAAWCAAVTAYAVTARLTRLGGAVDAGVTVAVFTTVTIAGKVTGLLWADIRPRPVPPSLTGTVGLLTTGGWQLRRWHPWLCAETRDHVHMTDDAGTPVIVICTRKEAPGE